MNILNEFERRLEGAIEGIFTKAFRTGLQPVELARRILREMEANKTVGVRGVWVPNRYAFRISTADLERFQGTERALRRELEQVVLEGAKERGWSLVGPPEVTLEADPSLRRGEYECRPELVEGPTAPPAAKAAEPSSKLDTEARLVVIHDGKRGKSFPLTKDRTIIGRLSDSDVTVDDKGVSRKHAEVRRHDGEFLITDLGSTNGTMVNESKVDERPLSHGDRITIGRTTLEFQRG